MDRRAENATVTIMRIAGLVHNLALAAVLSASLTGFSGPATAQSDRANELLERLSDPELRNADVVEQELYLIWSRSGSASADYLLQRGRDAMAERDMEAAYSHLTALVDHAPEFAEGWNARATLFFQSNRYGPAIADIQRVLALEPRHFGALLGLGVMLEEMGNIDAALDALRLAQEVNPHQANVGDAIRRIELMREGRSL